MFGIDLILITCIVILLIEIYNETHIRNYGNFIERIKYLFNLKTIFKCAKISFLLFLGYLLYKDFFDGKIINNNFFFNNIFKVNIDKIYFYLIPVVAYSLFIIMSNSLEILDQFSLDKHNKARIVQFTAFLLFIIYRIIAFIFTYIIFAIIFYNLIKLDNTFIKNNLHIFDWLNSNNTLKKDNNYNTGVYFSLILTLLVFFIFNNAFIKVNSNLYNYRSIEISFFGYFFITIILSIGIFFGFFSIFNAFYNIRVTSIKEWLSNENILGILPIRTTSILILVNLFGYIYSEILEKRVIPFLQLAILPIRNIDNYSLSINFEKRETLYFSQISFYILNIALAEYFIMIDFKNTFISFLNFAILFINDDYQIINDYSEGMQNILPKHFRKIHLFNILIFSTSTIVLIIENSYLILSIYLVSVLILIYLYLLNYSLVNTREYKF